MIAWILTNFGGYLVAAGAALAVLAGAYFKGRSDSAASAAADRAENRIQSMKTAEEVGDEVDSLDARHLDARLNRWLRDRERRLL